MAEIDSLDDSTYKDSTLIMQLLRDNLTVMFARAGGGGGGQGEKGNPKKNVVRNTWGGGWGVSGGRLKARRPAPK